MSDETNVVGVINPWDDVPKMQFTADVVRVYYNRAGDPQKLWSLDCGEGTPEIQTGRVNLKGVSSHTEEAVPLPADPLKSPSAWLAVEAAAA